MSDLYIPEDIRHQIIHKLPIKSLVRFTCVSKTWLSLIKNPTFISTHLKLSNNKNPLLLLRYCSDQNVNNNEKHTEQYSLYIDNKQGHYNHYMHFHSPFNTRNLNHTCYIVVGTLNGLVCLDSDTYTIIIWNPSIKKSITIPMPSSVEADGVSLGLGFDSRSNDYKILRLAQCYPGVGFELKYTLEAELYSLNMNSWKIIHVPKAISKVVTSDRVVFVNGVMHVLAERRVRNGEYHNFILGFDVCDEVFKEIKLPQSLVNVRSLNLDGSVYKGSIAVFEQDWVRPGGWARVWVMEEYGVVESWTRMFSIDGQVEGEIARVLGVRNNGELFYHIDEEIVSFEPESREVKRPGVSGSCPFVDYFVESMVLLDNSNAQSDAAVENDAIGDAADDAIGDAAGDTTAAND